MKKCSNFFNLFNVEIHREKKKLFSDYETF